MLSVSCGRVHGTILVVTQFVDQAPAPAKVCIYHEVVGSVGMKLAAFYWGADH